MNDERRRGLRRNGRDGGRVSDLPEAAYTYCDEEGAELFQVVRRPDKRFMQRRRNGHGEWTWGLEDTRRVIYELPRVCEALERGATIYVCEGEKDVVAMCDAYGVPATTNPMGAGKWLDSYSESLTGARRVVIVADRDEPGEAHAFTVRESLIRVAGIASCDIEIVQAVEGKDAADHIVAGHTLDDFEPVKLPRQTRSTWAPIDLSTLNLDPPEPPGIAGLVYFGRRHVLSGETESLKTWAALALSVEEIRAGRCVVFVDFGEGGRREVYDRLRALGLTDAEIHARFLYLEPEEPSTTEGARVDIATIVDARRPSLVVFDATTGALELHGLDPNNGRDIQTFYRVVVGAFRREDAALVVIDHLTRNREARGSSRSGRRGRSEPRTYTSASRRSCCSAAGASDSRRSRRSRTDPASSRALGAASSSWQATMPRAG